MDHGGCILDLPYPEIAVSGKNINYANLLLNDYAGLYGELSAITQYFYQYFILKQDHVELSESLECISIVEMKHMKILGRLITMLGGNPLLRTVNSVKSTYWRGNFISPTRDIKLFLSENIAAEKKAIEGYKKRIEQIDDPKVQTMLIRIILDEEHHIGIFTRYQNEFQRK